MTSLHTPFRALAIAVTMILLSACTTGPSQTSAFESPAAQTETPRPAPAGVTQDDLCEVARPLLQAVPREFVGTDEHVKLFTDLAVVAPEEMQGSIALLEAHYRDDVSPANPASQDFVNFPPHIQEAALELDGTFRELC